MAMAEAVSQRMPVRWYRLNRGWTLDELAARAHVNRDTAAAVEAMRSPREPRVVSVRRLAKALDVPVDALALVPDEVSDGAAPVVNLTSLRLGAQLSVIELARLAEVSPAVVYRAEKGSAVHPHYAWRLSQALDCEVCDWYPPESRRGRA